MTDRCFEIPTLCLTSHWKVSFKPTTSVAAELVVFVVVQAHEEWMQGASK